MNVDRAGKQTKAFWRSEQRHREKWEAEKPITPGQKAYGQYLRTVERLQGHAAGWIAGVAWLKREMMKKQKAKGKKV
jgi:hypothetical protein